MIKKAPFLSIFFVLFSLVSNAQQIPHYTQYTYNMQVLNPAFVGVRSDLSISLLNRSQWVGVEGAPTTLTFAINGRTKNGLGIGATVINDKLGLAKSTNVNLDASYTLLISREDRLAVGLKAGMTFFNNNLTKGLTPDGEVYNSTSGRYPNFGIGTYYYNRTFFVGLSVPSILKTLKFRVTDTDKISGIADKFSYFITAGAVFNLTDDVKFKPSTIVKHTPNVPISIDFNTNFLYKELIEVGMSYRYHDSFSAMFALIIDKKYRIGYAYDRTLTNLGKSNTHEIVLHVDFDLNRFGRRWLFEHECYF